MARLPTGMVREEEALLTEILREEEELGWAARRTAAEVLQEGDILETLAAVEEPAALEQHESQNLMLQESRKKQT